MATEDKEMVAFVEDETYGSAFSISSPSKLSSKIDLAIKPVVLKRRQKVNP
jgi:hypothetical protein